MKIENTSPYDTRALRTLLCRVHRRMSRVEGKLMSWTWLVVTIRGRARGYNSGRARIDGSRMILTLGTGKTRDVARLVWHELQHNYGYYHRALHEASAAELDWICAGLPESLPLKADTRRPRATVDIVARRHALAVQRLSQWQRKLKAAQRKVKEYGASVRRYERTYGTSGRLSTAS